MTDGHLNCLKIQPRFARKGDLSQQTIPTIFCTKQPEIFSGPKAIIIQPQNANSRFLWVILRFGLYYCFSAELNQKSSIPDNNNYQECCL
uniref:Uncharacterized protein n=1 Tax=mine drainage metagenome TaxID=410659 RepID=E6QW42_9ZZZZ